MASVKAAFPALTVAQIFLVAHAVAAAYIEIEKTLRLIDSIHDEFVTLNETNFVHWLCNQCYERVETLRGCLLAVFDPFIKGPAAEVMGFKRTVKPYAEGAGRALSAIRGSLELVLSRFSCL